MTDHEKALEAAARALKDDFVGKYMSDGYRGDVARMAIAAYLAQREADGFVMVPVAVANMLQNYISEANGVIAARPRGEG
jgi:hypothetical protein